ncbi:MAG: HD domain-containing protein [Candidatus Eisenbacteria bacterium]|nr:HD domain-containing protein [Candidatus Eisenbacteria bacterium]
MSEPEGVPAPVDETAQLAEQGAALLVRLSALMRTARTYDVSNQAFQRQMREFMGVIRGLLEDAEEATLVVVADYFYLNGVRVKARAEILGAYHGLLADFERRQVGGLRFLNALEEAEVERFFQIFLAAEDPALAERLPETVQEAAVTNIAIVPASDLEAEDLGRELASEPKHTTERRRAKKVFWRAMMGAKRIVLRAQQTGRPDLRHAKRVVQPIVDSIMKQDYSLVGLSALKDHDEYTYAHCVNVSVMSIGMGQTLRLPRQALADLGVAGLLHDLGKMTIPGEVLRKPGKLDAEEWTLMRRHPIEGAIMVSRMPGLSGVMLDTMRACLEHHMNYNRTGYPEIDLDWGQATVSRIVAMADCFDAITAHRAYDTRPRTPFEGLQLLLGPIRVNFDPAVLWSLVRTVGLYPAGTVLQTANNHVVMVMSPNPKDVTRPNCRVLARPDGTAPPDDAPELWEPMPESEHANRVLKPEEHRHDTKELLAA